MKSWYTALNPEKFNIVKAIAEKENIYIPQPRSYTYALMPVEVGDMIYLYVSVGYAQILYRLEVVETRIPRNHCGSMLAYCPNGLTNLEHWIKCRVHTKVRKAYKPLQCTALMDEGFRSLSNSKELHDDLLAYIEKHFELAKIEPK